MRRVSKSRRIARQRMFFLSILITCSFIIGLIAFSNKADAINSRRVYTYYTSYEIQSGDTLWTIADKFMGPDYKDKVSFINSIKKINHLSEDNITAGKYLVIEYSSYEKL